MTLSPSRGRIGLLGGRVRIGCNGNLNLGPAFQTDGFAFAVLQNIVDSDFLLLLLGTVHMDLCLFRSVRAHRLDDFFDPSRQGHGGLINRRLVTG